MLTTIVDYSESVVGLFGLDHIESYRTQMHGTLDISSTLKDQMGCLCWVFLRVKVPRQYLMQAGHNPGALVVLIWMSEGRSFGDFAAPFHQGSLFR